MSIDFGFIIETLPYLLTGLKITLYVSIISLLLSFIIGISGAIILVLKVPILSQIVVMFVEFLRNTPLLALIFLVFFGLPDIGITLSAFITGGVALSLSSGAYAVENFRGGLEAVNKNLIEAGQSLGMKKYHLFRFIIVPIGFRNSFTSFSNTCISTIKNSSLLAGIGLVELTYTAIDTISIYFKSMEMFLAIGILYLVVVWTLSFIFSLIEKKLTYNVS